MAENKKVLLFGVFDGLHKGHMYLLEESNKHGDVYVALPSDEVVEKIKNKKPVNNFEKRSTALLDTGLVKEVMKGDEEVGSWNIIEKIQPDKIILGYDQSREKSLIDDFLSAKSIDIEIVSLEPFEPETYKSSLLNSYE